MNIIGDKYGRWLVLSFSHRSSKNKPFWLCKCDCGTERAVEESKLRGGGSLSCGCYKRERTSLCKKVHGMSLTRFYGIWNDMMMRCYNPNKERYPNYGGRGIGVCRRWHTFNNFYIDMFPSYTKGLSLERKNVNKDYSKRNCEWIVKERQKDNKTNTIKMRFLGSDYLVADLIKIFNKVPSTVYQRIKMGKTGEKAIFGKHKPTRYEIQQIISEYSQKLKILTSHD